MFLGDDDVAAEHDLKATTTGNAVDRANDRLVEVARIVQSAKTSGTVVGIRSLPADSDILQVPACAKELLALTGEDGKTLLRMIPERLPHVVEFAAVLGADGVGLALGKRDL